MLRSYWPEKQNIEDCIRTEAEELAEHVLLAVHEPMVLTRRTLNDKEGEKLSENDLLNHLLEVERPIPIIGESGVGKSHAIRWLDAKLRVHPKAKDWHIVRIPKNASLRGVLEVLLEGLDGENFEAARKKIKDVGEKLKTKEVADHLIVFMGHRLGELFESTERELKSLREAKQRPDKEAENRIKRIQRHRSNGGPSLPDLLGDPNYQDKLVAEGKGIYQIAQRLTEGSSDQDLERNAYQVSERDFDFNLNLGDLSQKARQYVNHAGLNTMEERRQEVADLLNQILNEACRKTFQQLFQFREGSFQELFVEIRRHLFQQGKTLTVLVEDMAQISAIEDVLIDSLTQESSPGGEQTLCSIRSAIAVTDGYSGYLRRRATFATRAKYEWYIDKYLESEKDAYRRIENFCGRYLNAARHGKDALRDSYDAKNVGLNWPSVWKSLDPEEHELIDAFGFSESGHPLFPFNSAALIALSKKRCFVDQRLEFNPRNILHFILNEILDNFRNAFFADEFPPAGLAGISCPTTLSQGLREVVFSDLDRAQTLSAIWGNGSEKIEELASVMAPNVAKVFGFKDLYDALDGVSPVKPQSQVGTSSDYTDSLVRGGEKQSTKTNLDVLVGDKKGSEETTDV